MMRVDPFGLAHSWTDWPVLAAATASRMSQFPSAAFSVAMRPEGVLTTIPSTAWPPVPPLPPPPVAPPPPLPDPPAVPTMPLAPPPPPPLPARPERVPPPAPPRPVAGGPSLHPAMGRQQSARIIHLGGAAQIDDVRRVEEWRVRVGVAGPELAVAVVAPAAHVAGVEDGAGVGAPGGHGAHRAAPALDGGGEGVAHLVRSVTVGGRPERRAQLVDLVVAPALRLPRAEDGAGERAADGDRRGGLARSESDRLGGRRRAIVGVAEAELSAVVVSPAPDAVVDQPDAGRIGAGSDRDDAALSEPESGGPGSILRVAEAELSGVVGAPAGEIVVLQQRARVVVAGHDRGRLPGQRRGGAGGGMAGGVAGAELAARAAAPAEHAPVREPRAGEVVARRNRRRRD